MEFEAQWTQIYEKLVKERNDTPKTKPMPTIVKVARGIDEIVYGWAGLASSPKVSSQVQIKARKALEQYTDKLLELTDPEVPKIIANQIYFENMKAKMVQKLE